MAAAQESSLQPTKTVERINILEKRFLIASVVLTVLERIVSSPSVVDSELVSQLRYTAMATLLVIKLAEIVETFDDEPEEGRRKLRRAVLEAVAEVGVLTAAAYSPEIWQTITDNLPQIELTAQTVAPEAVAPPVDSIPVSEVTQVDFQSAEFSEAVQKLLLIVLAGTGLIVAKKGLRASGVHFRSPIHRKKKDDPQTRKYNLAHSPSPDKRSTQPYGNRGRY